MQLKNKCVIANKYLIRINWESIKSKRVPVSELMFVVCVYVRFLLAFSLLPLDDF